MGTINIREIDDDTLLGIDHAGKAAKARSREGYLREFLRRHFGKEGPSTRGIGARFGDILALLFEMGRDSLIPAPTLATVARQLGHVDTALLEAEMRGDTPVPFSDADKVCDLFGVSRSWLENGGEMPFGQACLYSTPGEVFVKFYKTGIPYSEVIFVLEEAARGTAMIFGKTANYRYDLVLANVPIHDDIGGGGWIDLQDFCLLAASLGYLGHQRILPEATRTKNVHTSGLVLDEKDFHQLRYGSVHPSKYFRIWGNPGRSLWIDDIWDFDFRGAQYTSNYTAAHDYWVRAMRHEGVSSNAELADYINKLFKNWQITDLDLMRMLEKNDPQRNERPIGYYAHVIDSAKDDPHGAQRSRLLELFDDNHIPLPDWLGYRQSDSKSPAIPDLFEELCDAVDRFLRQHLPTATRSAPSPLLAIWTIEDVSVGVEAQPDYTVTLTLGTSNVLAGRTAIPSDRLKDKRRSLFASNARVLAMAIAKLLIDGISEKTAHLRYTDFRRDVLSCIAVEYEGGRIAENDFEAREVRVAASALTDEGEMEFIAFGSRSGRTHITTGPIFWRTANPKIVCRDLIARVRRYQGQGSDAYRQTAG